ncbi:MAG: hypothetical protein ACLUFV_00500 [Acutalibacteraceae bacterium]
MSSTNNGHLVISPRAPDAAKRRQAPAKKKDERNGKMPSNKSFLNASVSVPRQQAAPRSGAACCLGVKKKIALLFHQMSVLLPFPFHYEIIFL